MPSTIIKSLLDTDAYKLHMQQAVFHHYPHTSVVAQFHCRNNDDLGIYIDEIKAQIDSMPQLFLTDDELNYLSQFPYFKKDYLEFLQNWRFDSSLVAINNENGKLNIRIEGLWVDVILWEIPLLAIISEVVHQNRTPDIGVKQAIEHLKFKLEQFFEKTKEIDLSDFNVMDFGTRRRYSFAVQEAVIKHLKNHFPNFNSTSNYLLAYKLGLNPVGTQAHEWFQAHQQLVTSLEDCQQKALQIWLDEYPQHLGIALTDCITTDAFLNDFNMHFATHYNGLRQDSGDPIEWGEKTISHYQKLGIDPKTKTLIFSDSLSFNKALKIYQHFKGRVKLAFGLGGHLACDIPSSLEKNTNSLNIVIKLTQCNGLSVAKLSDSPGKTISQDINFIKKLKKTFNVNNH